MGDISRVSAAAREDGLRFLFISSEDGTGFEHVEPAAASAVGRLMALRIDHAEKVALGVLEDDEILIRLSRPVAGRAEAKQPFDFRLLVVRVKVEMQSASFGRHPVDGDVGPLSGRVFQDDERVSGSGRPARHVAKRRLPERHHPIEVVDVDYDRPDSYRAFLHAHRTQRSGDKLYFGADDGNQRPCRIFRIRSTFCWTTSGLPMSRRAYKLPASNARASSDIDSASSTFRALPTIAGDREGVAYR